MECYDTREVFGFMRRLVFLLALPLLMLVVCPCPPGFAQLAGPPVPRNVAQPQANPLTQVKSAGNKLGGWLTGKKPTPAVNRTTGPNLINPNMSQQASKLPAPAAAPKPIERPPLLLMPEPAAIKVDAPSISKDNPPPKLPALDNPANTLGLVDPQNKLTQVSNAIDRHDYATARHMLVPLRAFLVDTTEAHINLYKALDNVSTARTQAELEKQLALQFAMMRDKAMYQSARIAISDRDYRSAIKDLVEVVKSQPRSDLGLKAYTLLQEIGFTEKLQIAE
jgi:hypothetical protein